MGKHFENKKRRRDDSESSNNAAAESIEDDMQSVDSEEEAMMQNDAKEDAKNSRKVGKAQDRDSTKNKLRLGDFHRNATFKQRNRKVTTKK